MKVHPTELPGAVILEPPVFNDSRGFFMESWNARVLADAIGRQVAFVQDCHSHSLRTVLRGIHYQLVRPQAKLVRVSAGEIYDVAVDLRRTSPTFGRWTACVLSAENRLQAWIPEGFGHGFLVLSDTADVLYKTTEYRYPEHERALAWNDPEIGIDWPLQVAPILATRDAAAPALAQAETYP
jgi:dTDP-4-dehydrorhamnose 3,5-epimerase